VGEVNWMRNLRAAGRVTISVCRRKEQVCVAALDETQRVGFFCDMLSPHSRRTPFGVQFIRIADGVDLNDPVCVDEPACESLMCWS
jgi:hypothetical protein